MAERLAQGASSVTYLASGGAVVAGGLSTNEMIAIGGFVLGFLTF